MTACPRCKKEIGYLDYDAVVHNTGTFQVKDEFSFYDDDWHPLNEAEFTFGCPECGEKLFTEEEDASYFLQGADVPCPSGAEIIAVLHSQRSALRSDCSMLSALNNRGHSSARRRSHYIGKIIRGS